MLQDRGHQVAIVTDGRMSGASGKVPAALHVTPEAAQGGPLRSVRDGDLVRLDTLNGTLSLLVDADEFDAREPARPTRPSGPTTGTGRDLFGAFRRPSDPPTPARPSPCPTEPPCPTERTPPVSEKLLELAPVVPVVVLHDAATAVPLARALVDGGLPVIEVTLRTPAALEGVRRIAAEVPDAVVGTGTVRTPDDVRASVEAGARFLVSPGATPRLLDAMEDSGLDFLPGPRRSRR